MTRKHVNIGRTRIGPQSFAWIAGPCSVESADQLNQTADAVVSAGAHVLRAGVFKMRTSPKSFQGLGEAGIELLSATAKRVGRPVVSEVSDPRHIEKLGPIVDMFQVGTRNMFNYALLKELGTQPKPVLLKRGFSAMLEELLLATEYIARGGNEEVVLCERGIRTFERATRNTLDLSAVPWLQARCPYPVIVDPSHGTGLSELVPSMTLAAIAAGADGVMLEVHPSPKDALSDGYQALSFVECTKTFQRSRALLQALGKTEATL